MKNTVYLLTGAAGYLGGNICRSLVARGERVRAFVLPGDPAAGRLPSQAELIQGDLLDTDALDRLFSVESGANTIVLHCASMVSVSAGFNQKLFEVNVLGTRNVVDKCLQYGAQKLVYVSSTGAIPEAPRGQVIREVEHFDPALVVGFYGQTKAEATQLVLDAVKTRGLDASIVFPCGIFGPNDHALGYVSRFVMDAAAGQMPAGIAGSFNAVDVRDLADGVIACAQRGRRGEGYIMANELVSIREMFPIISSLTGAREVRAILPIPVARVAALFAGLHGKITGKPAALTSFAIYNLARNNCFDSDKAKRELGYCTRPFAETMADTVAWLVREGKITRNGLVASPQGSGA